jgi:hypothetical protein
MRVLLAEEDELVDSHWKKCRESRTCRMRRSPHLRELLLPFGIDRDGCSNSPSAINDFKRSSANHLLRAACLYARRVMRHDENQNSKIEQAERGQCVRILHCGFLYSTRWQIPTGTVLSIVGRDRPEKESPIGETCMVRRRTARRIGFDENSLRKCIRPLVETGLRAHDDDPRVPVLVNPHGREDLVSPQVFRHVV